MFPMVPVRLNEGDWVRGISLNGEFFRGFVQSVDEKKDTVHVRVVQCDNPEAVGKTVVSRINRVDVLPVEVSGEEGYIRNMIDLALSTYNKNWFLKLTDELNTLLQQKNQNEQRSVKTWR